MLVGQVNLKLSEFQTQAETHYLLGQENVCLSNLSVGKAYVKLIYRDRKD